VYPGPVCKATPCVDTTFLFQIKILSIYVSIYSIFKLQTSNHQEINLIWPQQIYTISVLWILVTISHSSAVANFWNWNPVYWTSDHLRH